MAYPASEQIKIDAVRSLDRGAIRLRDTGLTLRAESEAGATEREKFLNYMSALSSYIDRLDVIAGITGIGATIAEQKPNFVGNALTEAQAMRTAAVSLRDWIFTVLETTDFYGDPDVNGVRLPLTFSVGQTAQFRTNVDAFVATIS